MTKIGYFKRQACPSTKWMGRLGLKHPKLSKSFPLKLPKIIMVKKFTCCQPYKIRIGVLTNSVLFGRTVPPNCVLFGGTVPPNSALFGGTVPPNSFFQL